MADTITDNVAGADTGLSQRTITAFFGNRSDADNAVDRLIEAGVSPDAVRLVPGNERDPETAAADDTYGRGTGFWDSLKDLFLPDEDRHAYAEGLSRGGYLVTVTTTQALYDRALDILDDEGTIDIGEREAEWRQGGWTGYTGEDYRASGPIGAAAGMAPTATNMGTPGVDTDTEEDPAYAARRSTIPDSAATGSDMGVVTGGAFNEPATDTADLSRNTTAAADRDAAYDASDPTDMSRTRGAADLRTDTRFDTRTDTRADLRDDDAVIPLAEERLRVGKRDVSNGRVRVRSYVVETPVSEDVRLRQERVNIERRPVDRPLDGNEDIFRDRSIELEERAEEAVIDKDVRVREELRLNKEASERTQTVSDTVRRTEVDVEDERGRSVSGTTAGASFGDFASQIQEHMDVISSDGQLIGKVDHLEGDRIKLTKNDSPDGQHHYLPLSAIDHVDRHVHINMPASQAKASW